MSKKTTTILIVIVLLTMILTGTFAWTQYNQHKTNEANGSGLKYDASLIENFKEIENWKVSAAAVTKEIRVKNSGLTGGSYGDVYVRLQLKEYMEMSEIIPVYSAYRYMIRTSGQFITYDDLAAWEASPYYGTHEADWTTTMEDGTYRYYVRTQAEDDNGQYGKFLTLSASSGDAIPLIDDTERAMDVEDHDLATNGECSYPIHLWTATSTEPEDCERKFHEYIKWYLGEDVISMDEWDGDPVKAWIYDTTSDQGWVYWGAALKPQETTSNLLEAIKLLKQPDGNFYYAIHTDMEAVSFSELGSTGAWSGVPEDILTALSVPTVKDVVVEASAAEAARGAEMNLAFRVTSFNGATEALRWTIEATYPTRMAAFSVEDGTSTIDGSTISQKGVLNIAYGETAISLKITATSEHDPKQSDFVTIELNGPLVTEVVVSGADNAARGRTESYSAVVNGSDSPSQEVRWEVWDANGNRINDINGTYIETATDGTGNGILHVAEDETPGRIFTVKAISEYDDTKSGIKEVTVGSVEVLGVIASPAETILARGAVQSFTAFVDSTFEVNGAVTWSLEGNDSDGTEIDPESGELRIADDETAEGLTVIATSVYDPDKSTRATVNIGQVKSVTVNETDVTLQRGSNTQRFTASVSAINGAEETVRWSVNSNNLGTGFTGNLLTIAIDEPNTVLTITATSTYNDKIMGTAVVKVGQVTGITLSSTATTLQRNGEATITPTVTPVGASQAVTWTLSGNSLSGGTTLTNGVLTIGNTETSQSVMVTAKSTYDDTKIASITIKVGQVTGVTLSPTTATLQRSGTGGTSTQLFAPKVNGVNGAAETYEWTITGKTDTAKTKFNGNELTIGSNETALAIMVTAKSTYDSTKTASAVVMVGQVIGVTAIDRSVSRLTNTSVTVNMAEQVRVLAVNSASSGVRWSLSGNSSMGSSTIDADGNLTVGSDETSTSLTVTATSSYDSSKNVTVAVTIVTEPEASVRLDTNAVTLARGGTKTFEAAVAVPEGEARTVDWSLSSTDRGSSITDGVLTIRALETAETLTVTATSTYDGTKSATATVTVSNPLPAAMANLTGTIADKDKTFTLDGYTWKVLTVDGSGNMMVTTTHLLESGTTQFRSDTTSNAYIGSTVESVINSFYASDNSNSMKTLRSYVQEVNLKTEATNEWSTVSGTNGINGTALASGLSVVDGTGTKRAFALSYSEMRTYFKITNSWLAYNYGTTTRGYYWLRTPGSNPLEVGMVSNSGGMGPNHITDNVNGVRPACWINLVEVPEIRLDSIEGMNLSRGTAQTLTAGTGNLSGKVDWVVEGSTSNSKSTKFSGSTLTIGLDETATTLTITAKSRLDSNIKASATVNVISPSVGDMITVDGYTWRVLAVDGSGNILITTTHSLASGTTAFNPNESDGNAYESSNLKSVIGAFYESSSMDALKPYVQAVNLKTEAGSDWNNITVDTVDNYNGISIVDGTGTKRAFALSRSEALKYFSDGTGWLTYNYGTTTYGPYWLRTPSMDSRAAARVPDIGVTDTSFVYDVNGVRPACWINLSSYNP